MNSILIKQSQIAQTLGHLQDGGRENNERVVLWLGIRNGETIEIREVYSPEQISDTDFFRIPKEAMKTLLRHLRETRYFIAAQVHSHPEQAFHSSVDDEWAIVRHVGALSLVLPYFGLKSTENTFLHDARVFELSPGNRWIEIDSNELQNLYYIVNE